MDARAGRRGPQRSGNCASHGHVGRRRELPCGILITHEHGDHAGGLRVLIKDLDCPIFMSAKTRDAYVLNAECREWMNRAPGRMPARSHGRDRSGETFRIGDIDFHPFTVPMMPSNTLDSRPRTKAQDRDSDGFRSHHDPGLPNDFVAARRS